MNSDAVLNPADIPKPRKFNVFIKSRRYHTGRGFYNDSSLRKDLTYVDTIEILRNFILSNPFLDFRIGNVNNRGVSLMQTRSLIWHIQITYNQNNEKICRWELISNGNEYEIFIHEYEKKRSGLYEQTYFYHPTFHNRLSINEGPIIENFKNYMDPIVSVYPALPSPNIRERINTALPGVVHNYLYNNNNNSFVPPMPPTAGGYTRFPRRYASRKANRRLRRRSNRRRLLRRSRNRR